MNKAIKKQISEDEYYAMLYREHEENLANALALLDKKDYELIQIEKLKYNEENNIIHTEISCLR